MSTTRRITVTSLHEAFASQFDERYFRPIAHPALGWGYPGCRDTQADFVQSIAWLMGVVKEEKSKVFIFGLTPFSIPGNWIKAAEVIIEGSEVEVVMIPFGSVPSPSTVSSRSTIRGGVVYVDKTGIFKVEGVTGTTVGQFWDNVRNNAIAINANYVVSI